MPARIDQSEEFLPVSHIKKQSNHRIINITAVLVMLLVACLLCSGCGASSQSASSSSKSSDYKQETFHDITYSIPKEFTSTNSSQSDSISYDLGEKSKNPFAASLYIQIVPNSKLTTQDVYDAEFGDGELVSANGIEMYWRPNAYSGSNNVDSELIFSYNGSLYMIHVSYMTDYRPSYKEFTENFYKSIKPANSDNGTNATSKNSEKSKSSSSLPKAKSIPGKVIEWSKASQHVGETVTLYGPVVGSEYASTSNGKPTFLDIGADYPSKNRLSITIWGKNRSAFSTPPEKLYEGKTIAVRGKVYLYDGVCNIEVTSPDQITIL